MNWMYVLIGGVILGGYFFTYLFRVRRSRKMDEYMSKMSEPETDGPQFPSIPDATRDMVQDDDGE